MAIVGTLAFSEQASADACNAFDLKVVGVDNKGNETGEVTELTAGSDFKIKATFTVTGGHLCFTQFGFIVIDGNGSNANSASTTPASIGETEGATRAFEVKGSETSGQSAKNGVAILVYATIICENCTKTVTKLLVLKPKKD